MQKPMSASDRRAAAKRALNDADDDALKDAFAALCRVQNHRLRADVRAIQRAIGAARLELAKQLRASLPATGDV